MENFLLKLLLTSFKIFNIKLKDFIIRVNDKHFLKLGS